MYTYIYIYIRVTPLSGMIIVFVFLHLLFLLFLHHHHLLRLLVEFLLSIIRALSLYAFGPDIHLWDERHPNIFRQWRYRLAL